MKQFKKIFALLLAAAMLFAVTACKKGPDVTGKYEAIKVTGVDGFEYLVGGEYVELKKNGKGLFDNQGYQFNLEWELEGETFTGTISFLTIEEPFNGTLKNGVLTIEYGDIIYVMTRGGVSEEEAAAQAGTAGGKQEEVDPIVGFYNICELITDDGTVLDEATLAMMGEAMATIDFRADGTVTLAFSGEEPDNGKWKKGEIDFSGEKIEYTVEDGIVVIDFDGNVMKFKKAEDSSSGGAAQGGAAQGGASSGGSSSPAANGNVAANFLDAFASSGSSMSGGSAAVTTTIENPSTWYGWMAYTDYYGVDPLEGFYDVWGYVNTADKPYFEVYQDGLPDNPMLSMYMEIEDGNTIVPDIGVEDAWFYDTYFEADDAADLEGHLLPNGTLVFSFPYDHYSGDYGWTVNLCLRMDGTPWDEENDVLPPRYDEYAAALGADSGSDAGTDVGSSGEDYGKTTADATGIVNFDTLKSTFTWLRQATGSEGGYARPTYEEIRDKLGCDAAKTHPDSWEDDYHVYRWGTEDGEFLVISFKVANGNETWNSTSWSSGLND